MLRTNCLHCEVFVNEVTMVCFALLLSFAADEAFSLSFSSFSHSDFSGSGPTISRSRSRELRPSFMLRCVLCSRKREADGSRLQVLHVQVSRADMLLFSLSETMNEENCTASSAWS